MTFKRPVFFIHDVLQNSKFTPSEQMELKKRDFFTDFKETMELLKGQKVTLLIVAAGISKYPEWVEYIKQHPEWKVELHCWEHEDYTKLDEEQAYNLLFKAKNIIEETFNQKVTCFYPPRNKYNDATDRIVERLGISTQKEYRKIRLVRPFSFSFVDVHYWYPGDRIKLERLIKYQEIAEPIFIIGAPRSGTTAFMRLLNQKTENSIALKEVEKIWTRNLSDVELWDYYYGVLKKNNATILIDKNVRNSLRLRKIVSLFPHAKFIHVIRDGRAVASSWKQWAIKTGKTDQSLEGSAKQWVEYLTAIWDIKKLLIKRKSYEEVRYEDLCKNEAYFNSTNYKWQKGLTEKEKETVTEIQKEWLKRMGYID